ncbi:ankyrin repeat and MYND domain-containing protein 1-like isoform X3 [Ruditapes philippinarum]|uniref:ankyrin repeat and MYND domain-containing protein 1-like isoform X3 n=1 Tax=Ruditapes philippinarum TaxID=129788 RepID=UPI00295B0DEE|nr:ankyrin repeat and MYND domain-containing protein 1-like isoform X3 [Ruditapes philippinarum]
MNRFPRLQSAVFEPLSGDGEVEVNYKSGASFKGQVQGHKKIGRGIFTWPNNARYEGEFLDNNREGSGMQLWPDGSKYDGQFQNDLRHGQGEHMWANKESYKGKFFQDRRHGSGTYTWSDGSTFTGTFYMDRKEGYGVFQFANGNKFEGLYKEDEREGPGVMTYPDGTQDVGLWHGEKLVKFCSAIPEAFAMKNHTDFDYNPDEHIQYLNKEGLSEKEMFENLLKEPDSYYTPDSGVTEKVSGLFNIALDPRSLAINKEAFDKEFYPEMNDTDTIDKIQVWNRTPSLIAMQKHFEKHKYGTKSLSFNMDQVLAGDKTDFKGKGPIETASEELIQAATEGNVNKVEDLLSSGKVSPDVADSNGHTALIGATVNWNIEVINCLLNHGADVNKLSDEGCSALSAGCIFFYPIESFHFNIAERYLEEPKDFKIKLKEEKSKSLKQDQQQQQSQQQNQSSQGQTTPKSILSKKQTGNRKASNQQKSDSPGGEAQLESTGTPRTEKNMKNMQNAKQQVRIEEKSNIPTVAVVTQDDSKSQEEFDSNMSLKYYEIEVSDQLIERCATQLSMNEKVVAGRRSHNSADLGTVRHLAVIKNERERMKATLDLLLQRGADPNASGVPMPVLFFAIKAADVEMVKSLLSKDASTSIRLPKEKGGLSPLHIASAIPGEEGVLITELLLKAGADPDVRAEVDDSFLNKSLMEEWSKDAIHPDSQALLGGRTPLHIACARDDNYKNITRVVHLLLDHGANSSLLCNGFSPLALCIASGNDMSIDELLVYGNEVSLPLTHGVGSALCAATTTEYEYRRPIALRIQLIDKLVRAGANVLAPIPIGPKRNMGTVVDYAYYMFYQDTHIAKTPYHALTHAERETFINRRKLLEHVGDILRIKAVDREKRRLDDEHREGVRSASPSSGFVYIGAGAQLPPDAKKPKFLRNQPTAGGDAPMVTFEGPQGGSTPYDTGETESIKGPRYRRKQVTFRKPLFKYCYQCGRSVFVRLSACTRCKEVYYCSKVCKLKAWNLRHKEECIRIGGRSRSPSPATRRQRAESPTPATNPDKGKKTTVSELNKDKQSLRIHSGTSERNSQIASREPSAKALSSRVCSGRVMSSRATSGYPRSHCGSSRDSERSVSIKSGQVPRKGIRLSAKYGKSGGEHDFQWGDDGRYIDNYSFE